MLPVATASAPVASRASALRRPKLVGDVGLLDVVGARRAAAELPVVGLEQVDVRDRGEQRARRRAHALRVRKVAGVLVCELERLGERRRRLQPELVEEDADVDGALRELPRLPLLGRALEEEPVLAHPRATARGVRHDRVHVVRERPEVSAGVGLRAGRRSAVQVKRAAAALLARDHHLDSVAREHPERRRVDLRREHLLGATRQQGDARAPLAVGGLELWQRPGAWQRFGQQVEHRTGAPGCEPPQRPR